MLFNATEFLIFLVAFALLFGLVHANLRHRNRLVVAASYLFYGWWDIRFLGLLVLSSLVDFSVGLALGRESSLVRRRLWIGFSLAFNLGILATFKYLGFFVDSLYAMLDAAGIGHPSWTWHVILPVGISFYTFQSLGYTLDVYWRRIEPCRDPIAFLAFVSFFPQLVAGPIERASHLLPQFLQPRTLRLTDLEEGLWRMLWGYFKKVVVADQLAPFAELAFDHDLQSGPLVLLGTVAFAGQIYGDFSGYSDIARGVAQALGFDLMRNFDRPYASTTIQDFWRRWHISLSTWLRDYLYIPLGGNRGSENRTRLNLLLTFLVAGLWHGAAWNFVLWGAWHGIALIVHRVWSKHARVSLPEPLSWFVTLLTVGLGWMLFRSTTPGSLARLHASLGSWSAPEWLPGYALGVAFWSLPLLVSEFGPVRHLRSAQIASMPAVARAAIAGTLVLLVAAYWEGDSVPFIYFQF